MQSDNNQTTITAGGSGDDNTSGTQVPPQGFQFTGNAKEYFGIWIVNLILSILTLGIYSAWAKVRQLSYFHSNTIVLGDRLAYHATGWMILKGRLISVAVIALLTLISFISPLLQIAITLLIIPAIPWVINQSQRFQARMTSWRNVRFNWTGTYWGAFKIVLLWPLATALSFGLLLPMANKATHSFIASNLGLGKTPFEATLLTGAYYKVFGIAALLAIPGAAAFVALAVWIISATASSAGNSGLPNVQSGGEAIGVLLTVIVVIWLGAVSFFYQIWTRNILINSLRLKDAASFSTNMKGRKILWIVATNTLAIPFSLFLLLPWSVVRMYRYSVESTFVSPRADLPEFLDERRGGVSSFGEEFGSMEGIDIAI